MGKPIVTITKKRFTCNYQCICEITRYVTTLVFLNNRQRGRVVNSEKQLIYTTGYEFLSFNYVY
jgi:hypothetical protein